MVRVEGDGVVSPPACRPLPPASRLPDKFENPELLSLGSTVAEAPKIVCQKILGGVYVRARAVYRVRRVVYVSSNIEVFENAVL